MLDLFHGKRSGMMIIQLLLQATLCMLCALSFIAAAIDYFQTSLNADEFSSSSPVSIDTHILNILLPFANPKR